MSAQLHLTAVLTPMEFEPEASSNDLQGVRGGVLFNQKQVC